jgi:Tol biopolymer transport system component
MTLDSSESKPRRLVKESYHVGAFDWSPDSLKIAYDHRPRPDADVARLADLSEVEVSSGNIRGIASLAATESDPHYSPDGRYLLYERSEEKP